MTVGTTLIHFFAIRTDLLLARLSSLLEPSPPLAAAARLPTPSRRLSVMSEELGAHCQGGEDTLLASARETGRAHEAGTDSGRSGVQNVPGSHAGDERALHTGTVLDRPQAGTSVVS